MMIRAYAVFLPVLPLAMAAAVPAPVHAQYGARAPYYSSAPSGPPPGYQLDPNDPDVAIRRPQRQAQGPAQRPAAQEGDADGQPGSGLFDLPGFGHQLDAQQQPVPDDANAIRPPAPIGAAAPPATSQQGSAPPPANASVMQLPPEDQPETGTPKELPENLKRQLVNFQTKEPAGTIIIDTPHTYLYLVLGNGKAIRYGIGVGREGFTWSGTERISRMKEWPDWFPPAEMIERQPYLPRMMAGGPGNPLGARALYLGHTLYRIHGTNQPSTIGQFVSSGCIRLLNQDIEDLYSRVQVGTRVVVLPGQDPHTAAISTSSTAAPHAAANVSPPTINGLTGKPMAPTR
ncbi:MAG TPA: L,D-transpeptidase [Pseudolabrys sp.]|nr:L,D-transpeptidase [Pseudolabrys sp.]